MKLLILATILASLTGIVAFLLPPKQSGTWLLGLCVIGAWIAPSAYSSALLWLGAVLVWPLWGAIREKKRREFTRGEQARDRQLDNDTAAAAT